MDAELQLWVNLIREVGSFALVGWMLLRGFERFEKSINKLVDQLEVMNERISKLEGKNNG